jgi:hypothetical protein
MRERVRACSNPRNVEIGGLADARSTLCGQGTYNVEIARGSGVGSTFSLRRKENVEPGRGIAPISTFAASHELSLNAAVDVRERRARLRDAATRTAAVLKRPHPTEAGEEREQNGEQDGRAVAGHA